MIGLMRITFQTARYELLPRLWIGGAPVVSDRSDAVAVDLLVLASAEYTPDLAGVSTDDQSVIWLPLVDDGTTPPTDAETTTIRKILTRAQWVHSIGGTVAFTCLAGQNRSALLGALLMVERGIAPHEAIEITARARANSGGWGATRSPALQHDGFRSFIQRWQRSPGGL